MPNKRKCAQCSNRDWPENMIQRGISMYCDDECYREKQKVTRAIAKPRKQLKSKGPKMTKIRASAKGEACTVRVPGICLCNRETTVLAHMNGGGSGQKSPDYIAAYACFACHSFLDGGYAQTEYSRAERDLMHAEAIFRTQQKLIEKGLLSVA